MVSQIKAREPQADGPGGYADESALVAGLRAGRPEAYEALHAAYATSIYNLALRIVDDPHEAQDVTQEVVIKVLRGLPRDEGDFTLPAWLYRVTANAAFDHLRARKRRPVTVASDAAPEPACVVDDYERAELSRRVEATLKELPKRQQVALVLRDVHGLSVGETASVLGVTRGSADVLLSRARTGFRKVFLAGGGGRCAEAERILAGSVGGGVSAADRALLQEHSRTCPDCGRTVALWGAAPVGIGLLLPQVALPAKLSFAATLAAAQAAGVALPAGLGAAAAAGASAAGATGSVAAASAATSAAVPAATAAGGAGVLAALGSAAGVKIAALAAVATAAVGIAGVATHERAQERVAPAVTPVALGQGSHGADGAGDHAGDHGRARLLAQAHHRDGAGGEGHSGSHGHAAGEAGHRGQQAKGGDSSGSHSDGHADGGGARSAGAGEGGSCHDGSGSGGGTHSGGSDASGGSAGGGSGDGGAHEEDAGSGAGSGGGDGGDSGGHSGGD